MNLDNIRELAIKEPKNLLEKMIKLQEECGELAQEVLVQQQSSGSTYKKSLPHGLPKECADILLVVLSIFFSQGYSKDQLAQFLDEKIDKWRTYQDKIT